MIHKLTITLFIFFFISTGSIQASCIAQEFNKTIPQTIAAVIEKSPCCVAACGVAICAIVKMVHLNNENGQLKEENRKINLTNETLLKVIQQQLKKTN